jgi:hypothetical protein
MEHHKAVQSLMRNVVKPEDAQNLKHLGTMQSRLNSMIKLTTDLNAINNPGNTLAGTGWMNLYASLVCYQTQQNWFVQVHNERWISVWYRDKFWISKTSQGSGKKCPQSTAEAPVLHSRAYPKERMHCITTGISTTPGYGYGPKDCAAAAPGE